jgi:serine/threonine protein kinase
MATGSPPWKELGYKNPISLFFHLKNTDDSPKLPSSIANPLLEEMLSKCFKRDPSKRPNASTLLNDNFFRAETEMTNTLSEVSNNLPRSSPVIMSPAIDNIRHQNVTDTGLEDSLCYSLTLPGPVHFDKQLKSDVDTSDWPDWAKHSHSLSILNNSNKPKQNPFARRGSTEVNMSC